MGAGKIEINLENASVATVGELGGLCEENHYLVPPLSSVRWSSKFEIQFGNPIDDLDVTFALETAHRLRHT
jgi:hypothetical protein